MGLWASFLFRTYAVIRHFLDDGIWNLKTTLDKSYEIVESLNFLFFQEEIQFFAMENGGKAPNRRNFTILT